MSASACAAPSVVEEVGYHSSRRNALGDIFENLDLAQLSLKSVQPRPGKALASSDSRRRRLADSLQDMDQAHFVGTCCTLNQAGAKGNTRVGEKKAAKNSAWDPQLSFNAPSDRKTSCHACNTPVVSSRNGIVKSSKSIGGTNSATTQATSHNTNHTASAQTTCDFLPSDQCHFMDTSNGSNTPQQQNGSSSNNTVKQPSSGMTPTEKKNVGHRSVSRSQSSLSFGEQSDSFSSSMAQIRAKDCAKRSMVC